MDYLSGEARTFNGYMFTVGRHFDDVQRTRTVMLYAQQISSGRRLSHCCPVYFGDMDDDHFNRAMDQALDHLEAGISQPGARLTANRWGVFDERRRKWCSVHSSDPVFQPVN